jgi:hypothetical protein
MKVFVFFLLLFTILSNAKTKDVMKEKTVDQDYLRRLMISRYDKNSKQFEVLNKKQVLGPDEYIHSTALAPDEKIYFITTKGISVFDPKAITLNRVFAISQFPTSDLNDLFVDSVGHIYVASSKGLFVSQNEGKSFMPLKAPGLSEQSLNSIIIDSQKNFFMGTESGLIVSFDRGKNFKTILVAPDKPYSNYNHIYQCFLSKQEVLACTSWHGVFVFDRKAESFRQSPIGSARSSQIGFDSRGRLCGIEKNSIYRSDSSVANFKSYKEEWGLKEFILTHCSVDSKDTIYAYSYKDLLMKEAQDKEIRSLKIPGPFNQLNDLNRFFESVSGELFLISWMHPYGDLED